MSYVLTTTFPSASVLWLLQSHSRVSRVCHPAPVGWRRVEAVHSCVNTRLALCGCLSCACVVRVASVPWQDEQPPPRSPTRPPSASTRLMLGSVSRDHGVGGAARAGHSFGATAEEEPAGQVQVFGPSWRQDS